MKILGAGLSGLIAGVLNQNAVILEPFADKTSHQALLRFRTPDIGEAVGIPFKKVMVYKGLWDGGSVNLSPKYIAQYARKTSDKISYRSICNLEPEHRWIAPPTFQDQLKLMCLGRIEYNCDIEGMHVTGESPVISTLPMNVLANFLDLPDPLDIGIPVVKPVYVCRFSIPICDVYMTVYFPGFTMNMYRASISGNTLIIESTSAIGDREIDEACASLGIKANSLEDELINHKQDNGKLTTIDEKNRKDFILEATVSHNIYSLGRFAIWKNILLDDVYQDILRIKGFINRDKYDHWRDR